MVLENLWYMSADGFGHKFLKQEVNGWEIRRYKDHYVVISSYCQVELDTIEDVVKFLNKVYIAKVEEKSNVQNISTD